MSRAWNERNALVIEDVLSLSFDYKCIKIYIFECICTNMYICKQHFTFVAGGRGAIFLNTLKLHILKAPCVKNEKVNTCY